jgi:uncharacterized MAPEG superfamily protein
MSRTARELGPQSKAMLSAAVLHEYEHRRVSSAHNSVTNAPAIRLRRLRRASDARAARHDGVARALKKRSANTPTRYPHFIAAALRACARGESPTTIARFGARYLPGLPENESDGETLLRDQIRKAVERKT